MRKVYISFLGTSPYLTCTYRHPEGGEVENVRYVQEATLSMFCRDWTPDDRIFIFTTKLAYEKNWLDGGYGKDSESAPGEGLKTRIEKLTLNAPVERIPIADMTSEREMWEIFQKMFDVLAPEDRVVFDITHAFRSIPMLAIVVLNYARVLKKIQLGGIYYGAFEVLGHPAVASNIPREERIAPVFDLTGFNTLLEWSAAIDGFLKSGDAGLLRELAERSVRPIMRDHAEKREGGHALRKLSNYLALFGKVLSTCRGQSIVNTTQCIRQNLEQCAGEDLIPAFQPLLDHIRPRFDRFAGDEIQDGVQAARWCLEHNLVQQGYTILQETLISYMVKKAGAEPLDLDARAIATSAVSILREEIPSEKWTGAAGKNMALTETFMGVLKGGEMVELMANITQERNDLNHAGFNADPRPPVRFSQNLEKHLNGVETLLNPQVSENEDISGDL